MNDVSELFERSFKITCKKCGWYSILRRNGGVLSMFINNFNSCPKCGCEEFETTRPTLWEKINPVEQLRKYYLKLVTKKHK